MEHTEYLIVGGSAAGMAAAEMIRSLDRQGRILVLSEEQDAPYFRPMIPFLISGKKRAEQIFLSGQGPYNEDSATIKLASRVSKVEPNHHQVTTASGECYRFAKMLIATGASPFIPPEIEGTKLDGVFALRSLDDAQRAAERANATNHAVMLGGGLLNLKFAFALLERKVRVTLVVFSPEVLSQLMEPEDAALIRRALEGAGLEILTGTSATEIIGGESGVRAVALSDGRTLDCQMVCIGKGVRPNTTWLDGSGIHVKNGVVADQYTQTNIPGIHTAGDVAVTFDAITGAPMTTGLWTNAVEMGRCAGRNMAGKKTAYGGTFGILNATQVARMPFVSMGIVHTSGSELEVHRNQTADGYRKLVFSTDGRQLVGAVFIGNIERAGMYRAIINKQDDIRHHKAQLLNGELHKGHLLLTRRGGRLHHF